MSPRKHHHENWFHRWKRPWRKPWRPEEGHSAALLTSDGSFAPIPQWSFPEGVELVHDTTPARWVEDDLLRHDFATLGALVPEGFDAYARILHPAYRPGGGHQDEPIAWAEVARMTGRTMHPLVQFPKLAGMRDHYDKEPDWVRRPLEGDLPREVSGPLLELLPRFTTTPETCWFCTWNGWGDLYALDGYDEGSYRHVKAPGREYLLLSGAVEMTTRIAEDYHNDPSMWWPDDRAWFVATEIDLDCTYVGASSECVAALMEDPRLETWPAALEDRVDLGSDTTN